MGLRRRLSGRLAGSEFLLVVSLEQQELLEDGLHRLDVCSDLGEAVLDAFVDVFLGDSLEAGQLQVEEVDRDLDSESPQGFVVAMVGHADLSPSVQVAFVLHSHLQSLGHLELR